MPRKPKATVAPRRRSPANRSEPSSHEEISFIFFGKLPMEIRIAIWKYALPGPRIVLVEVAYLASTNFGRRRVRSDRTVPDTGPGPWPRIEGYDEQLHKRSAKEPISTAEDDEGWDTDDDSDPFEESGDWRQRLWGIRTRCSTPAMLLACRESHNIASKVYCRAFGTKSALPSVWFDFEQDTLYLNQETFENKPASTMATGMVDATNDEISKQDLARVQNLAIRGDYLYRIDHALFLIPTFARFGNLRKFTAVLRHFEPPLQRVQRESKQNLEGEKQASLAFVDPICVDKAWEIHRGVYRQSEYYYRIHESELLKISPPLQKFTFNVQQLTEYREKWINLGFNKFEMPEIDQKIVTTLLS